MRVDEAGQQRLSPKIDSPGFGAFERRLDIGLAADRNDQPVLDGQRFGRELTRNDGVLDSARVYAAQSAGDPVGIA